MHKVRYVGPGCEGVSSIKCVGLIRTRDALKGNSAGLHVVELFLCRRLLQISREFATSISVFCLELHQNYWFYL